MSWFQNLVDGGYRLDSEVGVAELARLYDIPQEQAVHGEGNVGVHLAYDAVRRRDRADLRAANWERLQAGLVENHPTPTTVTSKLEEWWK